MANWGASLAGVAALEDTIDATQDALTSATYVTGTNVEYAIEVEYGTASMPPNRGLRDAIEQTMQEANAGEPDEDTAAGLCRWIAYRIEELWTAGIAGELSGPERVDTGNLLRSVRVERIG